MTAKETQREVDDLRIRLMKAERDADANQWAADCLHDLYLLHAEEWALNGGGPGIADRWAKAWKNAAEIFEP